MLLRALSVSNLRIIASVELQFDAGLVVFAGPNGSGKTSLLEAIHLLGTGRSFRARSSLDLVRRGEDSLRVRCESEDESGRRQQLAVERARVGGTRFRLERRDVRTSSELARHLPLVLVTPDSQRLLSDGAEVRRRLLDWLMFHVEPSYNVVHQRYRRALRQRNALLRADTAGGEQQQAWDDELAAAGVALNALREQTLERTLARVQAVLGRLCKLPVEVRFKPGWECGKSLLEVLQRGWRRDRTRGFTGDGPHRADLEFAVYGRPAQHSVSRGEGKVLTVAVLVAMAEQLHEVSGRRPLMLIDELGSELDPENRVRFFDALRGSGAQTFVTTVSEQLIEDAGWEPSRVFRMARGEVSEMLQ